MDSSLRKSRVTNLWPRSVCISEEVAVNRLNPRPRGWCFPRTSPQELAHAKMLDRLLSVMDHNLLSLPCFIYRLRDINLASPRRLT